MVPPTRESRTEHPLIALRLFRRRNYLGATLSQIVAGIAELGLAATLPILLVLNFEMDPALAGLAMIPTTIPMILIAPLGGRWYDRVGGRVPLVTGFVAIALGTAWMAILVLVDEYIVLLPGLLLYGVGLALVLTVNDPVGIDMIVEGDHGQASGVVDTGEQLGGAVGIALLGTVMSTIYVWRRGDLFADRDVELSAQELDDFRNQLEGAESTGLDPSDFTGTAFDALVAAGDAALWGFAAAFAVVALLAASRRSPWGPWCALHRDSARRVRPGRGPPPRVWAARVRRRPGPRRRARAAGGRPRSPAGRRGAPPPERAGIGPPERTGAALMIRSGRISRYGRESRFAGFVRNVWG